MSLLSLLLHRMSGLYGCQCTGGVSLPQYYYYYYYYYYCRLSLNTYYIYIYIYIYIYNCLVVLAARQDERLVRVPVHALDVPPVPAQLPLQHPCILYIKILYIMNITYNIDKYYVLYINIIYYIYIIYISCT